VARLRSPIGLLDEPTTVEPPFRPGPEPTAPRGVTSPVRTLLPGPLARRIADFDRRVDRGFDRLRGRWLPDRVFYAASELGDFGLVWHLVGGARALAPDRRASDALRISAILAGESALVNGGIKSLFGRARPTWDQPRAYRIRRPLSSSFPSGHASSAFTAAGVLSHDDPLWPVYYGLAAVVAASRVYVKIHHASDVVAGIATGVVLGRLARRRWPRRDRPRAMECHDGRGG
jgi:undecaprenyl-diphosphatase